MAMFHVGQRVTPKDDGAWNRESDGAQHRDGPAFGSVCVISHAFMCSFGFLSLVFNEWPDQGWDADDFRPVTDISSLEALLNSTPSDLPAEPVEPRVPVLNWGG